MGAEVKILDLIESFVHAGEAAYEDVEQRRACPDDTIEASEALESPTENVSSVKTFSILTHYQDNLGRLNKLNPTTSIFKTIFFLVKMFNKIHSVMQHS